MEGGSASRAQGFLQGPHPIRTPALAVTSFRPFGTKNRITPPWVSTDLHQSGQCRWATVPAR